MKKNAFNQALLFITFIAVITCKETKAQNSNKIITIGSLLKEMQDFDAVTRFPAPFYTMNQASSYDRRSISPDQPGWFANEDNNQFIRTETHQGRQEQVMLDADGPGAIVRFWLTTVVKPGTMRFYFDHEKKASIVVPAFDLMQAGLHLGPALLNPHSSYEPNGKGGNTLYLPLPYQKHCKITFEFADSASGKTAHYYQINYRTFAPETKVETFTKEKLITYRDQIKETESRLWHPISEKGQVIKNNQKIKSGGQLTLSLPEGIHAIRSLKTLLSTTSSTNKESMWRHVWINIDFDNNRTVHCPLGDFIGSGYGGKKITSWFRDLTPKGELTSRWVMPYQKSAKITIENKSAGPVQLQLSVNISTFKWDKNTLYFHATYKAEKNIKDAKWDYDLTKIALNDTSAPIDWNFARIKGKGVYYGNTLSVNNHMNSWYGEGDAKAYVDGEKFPSEFGTGLEDYYNTSWAPVILYQTPFANAPRADNPSSKGYNTFTRTRILDAIPFTKEFSFDMEMLSWDGGTIDASATTYWYGKKESIVQY